MNTSTTGIRIRRETVELLNKAKLHPRETHDDVVIYALSALARERKELQRREKPAKNGARKS